MRQGMEVKPWKRQESGFSPTASSRNCQSIVGLTISITARRKKHFLSLQVCGKTVTCNRILYHFIHIHTHMLLLSRFSRVRLCVTPEMAAHQAPHPWDSPGKNTGVGCHFLLQCIKGKSESEVAQSCPTPSNLMDCSLPGSSVHGTFQARVLEWGAIAFSATSS